MSKKAFTLIELLATIIILGVIGLIVYPTLNKVIGGNKEKAFQKQVEEVERIASHWVVNNSNQVYYENNRSKYLYLSELYETGFIDKETVYNPKTNEEMRGCVVITWKSDINQHTYTYDEECSPTEPPVIVMNVDNNIINSKGWAKENFFVKVKGEYLTGYNYCVSETECTPSTEVTGTSGSIYITKEGTNRVCVEGINKTGTTEIKCESYKLDKTPPTLIRDWDELAVITEGESKPVSNYFDPPIYSISGGDISCNPVNTSNLALGQQTVTCTATGNNGLTTTVSENISVRERYKDESGANSPNLASNMIPIKHDGTNWIKADTSQEWYNYNNKQWANAVTVTESSRNTYKNAVPGTPVAEEDILTYMVWIPRYKYKLFNANYESIKEQEIEIVFESKETSPSCGGNPCTTNRIYSTGTNGEYLTHPAFTFGTEELDGFWVGKFETSHETLSSSTTYDNLGCSNSSCSNENGLRIKPNVVSLRYNNVSNMFYASQSMNNNSVFGYDASADVHMMKNMEWGATAYLKQSKYGLGTADIGINNYPGYTTGCGAPAGSGSNSTCSAYNTADGMLASTTRNIYGVYDMSGGSAEYVMGNMADKRGAFQSGNAGFKTTPDPKYYDSYTYGDSNFDSVAHGRGLLGDATRETLVKFGLGRAAGWYGDRSIFVKFENEWFVRGGSAPLREEAGVFLFNGIDGGVRKDCSWRITHR